MRLSLAMIVKDEEKTIGGVLASAAPFCDELVVVDTGSVDHTREVAREHGAVVHDLEWTEDFAAARNASFDRCTGDWILWLDADDVLPEASQRAFAAAKEALSDELDAVFAPYHYRIGDDGAPLFSFPRERLIRRGSGLRWEGRVHERIIVAPGRSTLNPRLTVEHRPDPERRARNADRNLRILGAAVTSGDRSPRVLLYYGNELFDHERFEEAVEYYETYLAVDPDGADRYWALLSLAESRRILGDWTGATEASMTAIGEDPSRAEGYVTLGRVHFDTEEWKKAIPLFVAATAGRRPAFGFVRDGDYSYAPWDFLCVCYDKLGRVQDALSAAQRAFPGNPQRDRIRSNMHWMIDHLESTK